MDAVHDGDVSLYSEVAGSGRPVVLNHGWPLSSVMWEYQIPDLVEAGFSCVSYDRRGFGDSNHPWDGYDYDTLTADLAGLLDWAMCRWAGSRWAAAPVEHRVGSISWLRPAGRVTPMAAATSRWKHVRSWAHRLGPKLPTTPWRTRPRRSPRTRTRRPKEWAPIPVR